jgi:sensor histidine kinase regulating citrate/malate metabolism
MEPLQFALTIIILTVLFLAFALALTALILGNQTTQANIAKLFSGLTKRLSAFLWK